MRSSIDLSLVANDLAPRAPQNSTLRKVCQLTLSTKSCWTGSEAVAACMATVDAARFLLSAIWLRVTVKRRPCWVNILDSVEEVDGTDTEEMSSETVRMFSQAVCCSQLSKWLLFLFWAFGNFSFLSPNLSFKCSAFGFLCNFVEKTEKMWTFL